MLLKRAKIRAEVKAPEAAKEDQPFQVAVVLINEGKIAARDVRVHVSCPDGERELRLAEVAPEGGSAEVETLCNSATPGVNAVEVAVWYSDEKGRQYDPVVLSTKVVVHKRAPRLAGRIVPHASAAPAGGAVEATVEVVNDGDMSAVCAGEDVAEFSVPAGGRVALKRQFMVREGVNILGPLRFTCRDEKGREYAFVTDAAEVRGEAKKPLSLTVRATAPAETSGGKLPVEVEVINHSDEEVSGELRLPASKGGLAKPASEKIAFSLLPGAFFRTKVDYICQVPPRDEIDEIPPIVASVGGLIFSSSPIVLRIRGARPKVVIEAPAVVEVEAGGEVAVEARYRGAEELRLKPARSALGYAEAVPRSEKATGGSFVLAIRGLKPGIDYLNLANVVAGGEAEVEAPTVKIAVKRRELKVHARLRADAAVAEAGGSATLKLVVSASQPTKANITLYHNGLEVKKLETQVGPNPAEISVEVPVAEGENQYMANVYYPGGWVATELVKINGVKLARRPVLKLSLETPEAVDMFKEFTAVAKVINVGNAESRGAKVTIATEGNIKLVGDFIRTIDVEPGAEPVVIPILLKSEKPGRGTVAVSISYSNSYERAEKEVDVRYVEPRLEIYIKPPHKVYVGRQNIFTIGVVNHSHFPVTVTRIKAGQWESAENRVVPPEREVIIPAKIYITVEKQITATATAVDPTGRLHRLEAAAYIEPVKASGLTAYIVSTTVKKGQLKRVEIELQNNYSDTLYDVKVTVESDSSDLYNPVIKFASLRPQETKRFSVVAVPRREGSIDFKLWISYTAEDRTLVEEIPTANSLEVRGSIDEVPGGLGKAVDTLLEDILPRLERQGPDRFLLNSLAMYLNAVNKYYRDEKFKLDEELEALAAEDLVAFHNKLSDLKARLREIKTLTPRA
jgi:hypothetical protein